jgi:D-Tyr-tRNAtyr deacylase
MDWDALIEVLSETVRDDNVRADIYKKLFDLVGTRDAEDSEDQDDVFDKVLNQYIWDDEDDKEQEEDDGFNYDEDE